MYDDQLIETLRQGAIGLLDEWGLDHQTNVELLNISENATFRAEEPETGPVSYTHLTLPTKA